MIKSVELKPLRCKYYNTYIVVHMTDAEGYPTEVFIELYGGNYKPSEREMSSGWEPDHGMDHVESEYTYMITKKIMEALQK